MWEDGIRVVIPVWRDDEGNRGLEAATRARFTRPGGTTLEGVRCAPTTLDFAASIRALRSQLDAAVAQYGADRVAVFLTGFDEVEPFFAIAAGEPVLTSVRWYGSDGAAQHEGIVANSRAAEFAARIGYPSPVFALDEGARDIWQPLHDRIRARTDHEPSLAGGGTEAGCSPTKKPPPYGSITRHRSIGYSRDADLARHACGHACRAHRVKGGDDALIGIVLEKIALHCEHGLAHARLP
jgi:hypothetical protein